MSNILVTRLHALMNELDGVFELAGIGEDFVWPEERHADLLKPVAMHPQTADDGAIAISDDDEEG